MVMAKPSSDVAADGQVSARVLDRGGLLSSLHQCARGEEEYCLAWPANSRCAPASILMVGYLRRERDWDHTRPPSLQRPKRSGCGLARGE